MHAIASEIKQRRAYLNNSVLKTIYFGGGTPSLLNEKELELIFNTINKEYILSSAAEITLEANPDDINGESLNLWKKFGINRLSIGLQSFIDEELKWMNRAHTAAESLTSVKMSQDAGFSNITIDLIYGSKFQDMNTWEKTLKQAVDLKTNHISSYNLTIENKTVLGNKYSRGLEPAVSDELSSKQFILMTEYLKKNGFVHYEISNFGREGAFAVHNSNYWLGHHYLGVGPSAHSYNGSSRQWNIGNNNTYIKSLENNSQYFQTEQLEVKDLYNEYVLTRLRTIWGCDIKEIKEKFGLSVATHFLSSIEKFSELVVVTDNIYTLNNAGKLQADGIAADLFII